MLLCDLAVWGVGFEGLTFMIHSPPEIVQFSD